MEHTDVLSKEGKGFWPTQYGFSIGGGGSKATAVAFILMAFTRNESATWECNVRYSDVNGGRAYSN